MKRRDFVFFAAAAAVTPRRGRAQDKSKEEKLKRVGAMSGNFGNLLTEVRDWSTPASPGKLDIMDFPDLLADKFGMHNVEVQQIHLLSMEPEYIKKFKERVRKAHSRMVDMPIELDTKGYSGTISVCSADEAVRTKAIEATKKWIDIAGMLDCPSVMPNQGTFAENLQPAIAALKELRDYGRKRKVAIILEPRGRSEVDVLVDVIKQAGIYANPDIGNFPDEFTAERGLRMLYGMAKTVSHVKFNQRRNLDFAKAIAISKQMDFQGTYSLETGGPDPYAAMQTVLDKLLENL